MQKWLQGRSAGGAAAAHDGAAAGGHEPVAHDLPPLPSERSTGLVLAAAAAVAAVLLRPSVPLVASAGLVAATLAGLAIFAPSRLAALNRAWFGLALVLNRVMSPVIMLILFALLIVPAGLLMQLLRDPLSHRRAPLAATYWRPRGPAAGTMRDQF